jgi:serine/threonine protein kinase
MPSDRVQRQLDRLLDEAEQAFARQDWLVLDNLARQALALDAESVDAQAFAKAASEMLGSMPSAQTTSKSIAAAESQRAIPAAPTSFAGGRYQVKRFLGEGGKKRVFLAHDTLLDRDVAFALIKTEGLDEAGRDRIIREAQAMGRLGAHPHIVSVFDLGEEPPRIIGEHDSAAGPREFEVLHQPFIVTELMGGGDVEGLIEKAPDHRPPLERTLEIGAQVCRGLEFAHASGIIHRDLKPGNVWLTADGTAKIGDFGLAVAIDKTRLTQAGMMVGTVSYMPPEQAMGGEVTPQSDLYSLGAMLYEMVTGRPPFVGDESVAIITQHLNAQPVVPSWHNAGVSPVFEALILQLLEKDAAKRPGSARQVRDALEGIRSNALPVIEEPSPSSPAAASDNPMYQRTFVGREHELQQLQTAYDAATSGQGALAMVVGEPGIGKTSLCEQLSTYATIRGGRTLIGHCYEEGSLSLPYLPFVEAMRSYVLAREPDGLRAELGTGAGEVARIVSEIRERLHIEPSPANPADAEEERYRLFQGVSVFLRSAAAVQPLVIVLEDLHDADRGTLDLLVHLARNLSGTRLLLIGTYRDVEVDRAHPLSATLAELRRGGNFSRVLLRGLTADEVQRMMSQLSGQEVPWRLAEAVHRQTEGNPLFIQEVLRYLVEEGIIKREDGHWRRADEDTPLELGIPEGLRDVIGKRLSRLSAETNTMLATAAVMGREFRLDVLERVAGLDDETLEAALAEARSVAVVEERSAPGGSVSYRFTHAFFRQTLYEETIAPRRIRLHQQVARALEAVYGRRLEEHAAELAEHYAYSSYPADLAKAVSYGELAAQRAMNVYAYGEAERHLEQALKVQEVLDPDDKTKRCDLLLALGQTMLPAEEPARVVDAAEPAFALAEEVADQDRAARASVLALDGFFREHQFTGVRDMSPVRPWIERADQSARDGTNERILTDAYVGLFNIGEVSPAAGHAFLRRAADAALVCDDNRTFFKVCGIAMGRLMSTRDRERVRSIADAVLSRPRNGAESADVGTSLIVAGEVLLEGGDRQGAELLETELEELARRTRDASVTVNAMAPEVRTASLDGRFEDVIALAAEAERTGAQLGVFPVRILGLRARALVYLGRYDDAQNLPHLRNIGGRGGLAITSWVFAHVGKKHEASELRARFGNLGDPADETASTFLADLLESALLCESVREVSVLEEVLQGMAKYPKVVGSSLSWARILGGAATLLGERDKANEYYRLAITQCEGIHNRPELALTHLQVAELLLSASQGPDDPGTGVRKRRSRKPRAGGVPAPPEHDEAMRHLDIAIGEFREMQMRPALERALRHKEVLKA